MSSFCVLQTGWCISWMTDGHKETNWVFWCTADIEWHHCKYIIRYCMKKMSYSDVKLTLLWDNIVMKVPWYYNKLVFQYVFPQKSDGWVLTDWSRAESCSSANISSLIKILADYRLAWLGCSLCPRVRAFTLAVDYHWCHWISSDGWKLNGA